MNKDFYRNLSLRVPITQVHGTLKTIHETVGALQGIINALQLLLKCVINEGFK